MQYVSRVKIRDFKRDINSWVSLFSYSYILFSFTFSSPLLSRPHPHCLFLALARCLLFSTVARYLFFTLTRLLLSTFVWCRFSSHQFSFAFHVVPLYLLTFASLLITNFARVCLAPFSASSMFVWCALVECLVRHPMPLIFTRGQQFL